MAQQIGVTDLRSGMKVEVDGQPYNVVMSQFVKPGKGQPFARVKLKHLLTDRTIERTFKSGEKVDMADVTENKMRMLYREADGVVLMDDNSYEQVTVPNHALTDIDQWLKEDLVYDVVFYRGEPVSVTPPTFMELKIVEADPGARGDTASGRVLKPAVLETGAKVQIPIFVEQDEIVKIDTRTGEYVSRVSK